MSHRMELEGEGEGKGEIEEGRKPDEGMVNKDEVSVFLFSIFDVRLRMAIVLGE